MAEFGIKLLEFLEAHWQDICLGCGVVWLGLKKPSKSNEERQADKHTKELAKAEKRANKSVLKAQKDVKHMEELKNE